MRNKLVDGLSLFLSSEWHRTSYSVEDINNYLVAPLQNGRMKIFYEGNKPTGLVSWVFMSKDRAEEFRLGSPLTREDFENTEGDMWGVDLISDGYEPRRMLQRLTKLKKRIYPDLESKVNFIRYKTDKRLHGVAL